MKVLLIDVDTAWLKSVGNALRDSQRPIECVTFSDSLAALDYFYRHEVDLVISEAAMPELEGFLLIEAVRQDNAKTPIIVMSANPSLEAEALTCGASAFVPKSSGLQQLLPAIERVALDASTTGAFHA